jgi:hypothetical protein
MSTAMDTERIDLLILARLAGPLKKPPPAGKLRDELERLVKTPWSTSEWHERFDERLAALRERGDLMPKRLVVTDAGRARIVAVLGVDPVPKWQALQSWLLPALALGLAPGTARVRERLSKAEGLRGAVLAHTYDLGHGRTPTLNQAMDALAWRHLGVETDRPLTIEGVRQHLLAQFLEGETRLGAEKIAGLLAAKAAGASQPAADRVREALVRKWLDSAPDEAAHEPAALSGTGADPADAVPTPISGPTDRTAPASIAAPTDRTAPARVAEPTDRTAPMPAPGLDLAAFAREVQAAADREQEGRFGTRKVFIAAVWRRLRETAVCAGMDLDAFKRHLVDANRADLLALHRADLVPMMDPEEVKASEILYGNASFHFIESPFVRR